MAPGGNTERMPKVDPETQEPISDAPDGPADLAGGKLAGDPGMEDATENGAGGTTPGGGPDDTSRQLPGEKGGAASGGGT